MNARLSELADRCVRCGLCLPHCPTYLATGDEAESPRGRIALIQGLATGQLPARGRLAVHLDRCLHCRACEAACPSGVAYGELILGARAELARARAVPASARRLTRALAKPRALRRLAAAALRPARALLSATGSAHRLALARTPSRLTTRDRHPAVGPARGAVALFLGCTAEHLEGPLVDAAIRVLRASGFEVHVPHGQGCCGAAARHAGETADADALARANARAFAEFSRIPRLYFASPCGMTLRESDMATGGGWTDLNEFLAANLPDDLHLRPLAGAVAVHEPCSARNVLRNAGAAHALLRRIPGLAVRPLPDNAHCCGGAGAVVLSQPALSDAIGAAKVSQLAGDSMPDWIATTSPGCSLQLRRALRRTGLEIPVIHPVELVERQLAETPP